MKKNNITIFQTAGSGQLSRQGSGIHTAALFVVLLPFLFLTSCMDLIAPDIEPEPEFDNPIDIDGPGFVSPHVIVDEVTSGDDGNVVIKWRAGPTALAAHFQYRYRLGSGDPSDWDRHNTIYSGTPAPGTYSFSIETRYAIYPDEPRAYADTTFSLYVYSTTTDITLLPEETIEVPAGGEFDLTAGVARVTDLFAANIVVRYDPDIFEVVEYGISENNIFQQSGLETLDVRYLDHENGWVEFASVMTDRSAPGVNGAGPVGDLRFRVKPGAPSGEYTIRIDEVSDLRNTANQSILEEMQLRTVIVGGG